MSVRDDLIAARLRDGACCEKCVAEVWDPILAQHAHELAEQQRAYAAADQKRHRDEHGCDDYEVDMCAAAVREVADLIDPKAAK